MTPSKREILEKELYRDAIHTLDNYIGQVFRGDSNMYTMWADLLDRLESDFEQEEETGGGK